MHVRVEVICERVCWTGGVGAVVGERRCVCVCGGGGGGGGGGAVQS